MIVKSEQSQINTRQLANKFVLDGINGFASLFDAKQPAGKKHWSKDE